MDKVMTIIMAVLKLIQKVDVSFTMTPDGKIKLCLIFDPFIYPTPLAPKFLYDGLKRDTGSIQLHSGSPLLSLRLIRLYRGTHDSPPDWR